MGRKGKLRELPSVSEILEHPEVAELLRTHARPVVRHAARRAISRARARVLRGAEAPGAADVAAEVVRALEDLCRPSLQPVINATGIALHTNLGRAPLGPAAIEETARIAGGYCNLEFDLAGARRGDRNAHVRAVLKVLTSAEDVLVVNNNAAGIILSLNTLARDREVVISRGELIEIGGSFRIPEIMAASGARMVEVGTTNRTHLSDYRAAITPETALIFKAHKSNYCIRGFTEEVPAKELAALAREHSLVMMYDVGSGLLRRIEGVDLGDEPDVEGALADGADIVAFSCDKLLGGPQAGVLAGRGELISRMARAPLMRAMRVGKLTLAALSAVCRQHLTGDGALAANPTLAALTRTPKVLEHLAAKLVREFKRAGIAARRVESSGRCGGGALPDLEIKSAAVEVTPQKGIGDAAETFAERLFRRLLDSDPPVLAVLREGRILFDMLTVLEGDIPLIARATSRALEAESAP
ncbi:MAG: L-seryl-tRNA(Sec) selenium transferase [Planctomycetota bacterium]|jgi:L-seryl-tRNA(Ser) seleniumtransferase